MDVLEILIADECGVFEDLDKDKDKDKENEDVQKTN